jgi:hypothetical protein
MGRGIQRTKKARLPDRVNAVKAPGFSIKHGRKTYIALSIIYAARMALYLANTYSPLAGPMGRHVREDSEAS